MAYLTEEEYEKLGFSKIEDPFSFDSLLKKASSRLDSITMFYYHNHDIETDNAVRVNQFKMALGAQIEYMQATRVINSADALNRPQSWSIGRTSISNATPNNTSGSSGVPVVNQDVYNILSGTGLLNRGDGGV